MKLAVVALAALIGFVPVCFSQLISGNIVGSVVDATGAVVPAANVEAENIATGIRSTTTTDANGLYRFNNVPAGEYNITIKKAGFADATLRNLTVELNKTTTANVVMQVAAVTTTVEVVEATSAIDTTTVQLQNTFHSDQIVDLPIIEQSGTSFGALNLALLGAGVASNGGIGQGQGPSIGGQRPMNNNFMVEGIDNNSKTVTGP
ncbi:MAG TPA: carboxypeptidase-like regulatory domain-containing protein, partial [Verrucomicrobiae bacterium]|nr:carboxypeptidase-like regulatory domain-containing protein [Verrucomicrobiae bacterium]